jgi:uncharacterized protein (TIGR03435 family)
MVFRSNRVAIRQPHLCFFPDRALVKTLRIAVALLLAPSASILCAQRPVPAKEQAPPGTVEPLIVDVHVAPYRASVDYTVNISHQRFDMRNVTIVNMIDFVHGRPDDDGREDNAIAGGPTWIDFDRFDVVAMIPTLKSAGPNNAAAYGVSAETEDKIRPIVERILAERFNLKYHMEDRPLPGYVMTVGKDGAKLTEAKDPAAPNNCQSARDQSNGGQVVITCTSETLAEFIGTSGAATIGGNFRHPILDRTGLTKPYDFTLRFSSEQLSTREDTIHGYIDVFNKQLGLVIAPGDVPQPAIVVDAVDHTPTPNPPDVAKQIAAIPDLEFEVATIKPAADNEPQRGIRLSGSQISLISFSVQELLTRAWELGTGAMLGNRPDWLGQTRYTIQVKLPPGVDARALSHDSILFDEMLKKLLTDRFQMKYHWGEQTIPDAYVLYAGTAKMKKADPNSRTYCKYGPPEGEKDVRTVDSPFNLEFHCQNVTMDQFADLAQPMANAEIKYRVPNKTGLAGSYDFALYCTTTRKLRADTTAAEAAAKQAGDATAAPVEGVSIEDAFRKQLGLKLEKQPLTLPALVLDHIEEKPTEN